MLELVTGADIASLKAAIKLKYGIEVTAQYAADLIAFVREVGNGTGG